MEMLILHFFVGRLIILFFIYQNGYFVPNERLLGSAVTIENVSSTQTRPFASSILIPIGNEKTYKSAIAMCLFTGYNTVKASS